MEGVSLFLIVNVMIRLLIHVIMTEVVTMLTAGAECIGKIKDGFRYF